MREGRLYAVILGKPADNLSYRPSSQTQIFLAVSFYLPPVHTSHPPTSIPPPKPPSPPPTQPPPTQSLGGHRVNCVYPLGRAGRSKLSWSGPLHAAEASCNLHFTRGRLCGLVFKAPISSALVVGLLPNVPVTRLCISRTDLLGQLFVLPTLR